MADRGLGERTVNAESVSLSGRLALDILARLDAQPGKPRVIVAKHITAESVSYVVYQRYDPHRGVSFRASAPPTIKVAKNGRELLEYLHALQGYILLDAAEVGTAVAALRKNPPVPWVSLVVFFLVIALFLSFGLVPLLPKLILLAPPALSVVLGGITEAILLDVAAVFFFSASLCAFDTLLSRCVGRAFLLGKFFPYPDPTAGITIRIMSLKELLVLKREEAAKVVTPSKLPMLLPFISSMDEKKQPQPQQLVGGGATAVPGHMPFLGESVETREHKGSGADEKGKPALTPADSSSPRPSAVSPVVKRVETDENDQHANGDDETDDEGLMFNLDSKPVQKVSYPFSG